MNFAAFGNSNQSSSTNPNASSQSSLSQPPKNDGTTWWFKTATKACGTIAGMLSVALGLFACITFHTSCLAAGLLQMFIGFVVVVFEAPCCCMCLDFIDRIAKFSDSRPPWQKALLYALISPIPLLLCLEVSTFFGPVLIFITAILYGMMALGKKADRQEMISRATAEGNTGGGMFNFGFGRRDTMDVNLVDRDKQPTVLPA